MTRDHRPLLITFGSMRQAAAISRRYRAAGCDTVHFDDRTGRDELISGPARAIRAAPGAAPIHLVSYARASTPGAVATVAAVCRHLIADHPLRPVRAFAPTPDAARLFDDKWATHQRLTGCGVPTVPSRLVTVAELARLPSSGPIVAKLLDRTGGVGVVGGRPGADLVRRMRRYAELDEPVLAADFIDGYEMSVKALVHGGVHPVAVVIKERTRVAVVHGDWKLKLAFPLPANGWAIDLLRSVAAASGTAGFLSVEGIWDTGRDRLLVSEVAGRGTGSSTIADAVSTVGGSARAIQRLLNGGRVNPIAGPRPAAMTVALEAGPGVADAMPRLGRLVLGHDIEDLSGLPGSIDRRIRHRIHLRPPPGQPLESLEPVLEKLFGAELADRLRDLAAAAGAIGLST